MTAMVFSDISLRQQDGYAFVYNIANRNSFHAIEELGKNARSLMDRGSRLDAVLIAVKHGGQGDGVVAADEGRGLARELGMKFSQVNLDTGADVMEAYFELVRVMRGL